MKSLNTIPKNAADLTLEELNSFLPNGWAEKLVEIAKDGGGDGSFITALGITPTEFYALARENEIFKKALECAQPWILEYWERNLKRLVFGDLPAHAVKPILWALELEKARLQIYQPPEREESGIKTLHNASLRDFQNEARKRGIKIEIPKGAKADEALAELQQKARFLQRVLECANNQNLTPELEAALEFYAGAGDSVDDLEWLWKLKNKAREAEWTFEPRWKYRADGALKPVKETPALEVKNGDLEE